MTQVEAGGATVFPYIGARVLPQKVVYEDNVYISIGLILVVWVVRAMLCFGITS